MRSRAVKRIEDVAMLRSNQMPEVRIANNWLLAQSFAAHALPVAK